MITTAVFIVGKIFLILAMPGNFLTLMLALGVARLSLSHRRRGFELIVIATAGLLALMVFPVGEWLLLPLEDRFPLPVSLPPQITGLIVLGGSVDESVSEARGQTTVDQAAERLTEALALAHRYPSARIVLSGGHRFLFTSPPTEASIMERFLADHGIDRARLTLEDRSRTTYENAMLSYETVQPKTGETWLLVTTASHMPRAVGSFRHAGWVVTPYPVGYRTTGHFSVLSDISLSYQLILATVAMREWAGLLAYWIIGRTSELLPGSP